jgi:carbamoylphosphate synthase large subunit
LDTLKINQPEWQSLKSENEATFFAKKIGYPVLIRPSYVLSGSAMNIASNPSQLRQYLRQATQVSSEHPVVISKFVDNAKEIEIDGVAQNGFQSMLKMRGCIRGMQLLCCRPKGFIWKPSDKLKMQPKKSLNH